MRGRTFFTWLVRKTKPRDYLPSSSNGTFKQFLFPNRVGMSSAFTSPNRDNILCTGYKALLYITTTLYDPQVPAAEVNSVCIYSQLCILKDIHKFGVLESAKPSKSITPAWMYTVRNFTVPKHDRKFYYKLSNSISSIYITDSHSRRRWKWH